jgi:aspartyl-tRNA(Asn)/glutamyl-tRNA(Gln) amidotransferase subunit B
MISESIAGRKSANFYLSPMPYSVVIGLEVHAQLATHTKMFCSCKLEFGSDPNTLVCPVCLGMPGTLPTPNATAIEYAVAMGLACGCTIDREAMWTRKNYFYPDLPKGYQITQQGGNKLYDRPICTQGQIEITLEDGSRKSIGLTRIHMEEDAGKLIHDLTVQDSLFDANRCGTPLIEIVSDPDLRTPREAYLYLEKLKQILEYLEVCDANMERGNLRVDANISLRLNENAPFGKRVELKNMNSFHNIEKALHAEIESQTKILDAGGTVPQQTKRWDVAKNITVALRTKEDAHDYRYFPEPDLVRLHVDEAMLDRIRATLPELPEARQTRYATDYGLPAYDAQVLTREKTVSEYFEAVCKVATDKKAASNWVMGEVLRIMKDQAISVSEVKIKPHQLGTMINLIGAGTITGKIAKTVFEEMMETGKDPEIIIQEKGLVVINDSSAIEVFIQQVLDKNPKEVEEFRGGKIKLMGFFVGQIMKVSGGKANPEQVNGLLRKMLEA